LAQKNSIIKEKRACYYCLQKGHGAKNCLFKPKYIQAEVLQEVLGISADRLAIIADVDGPYGANGTNNDSSILKCITLSTPMLTYIENGDLFIVDRGFRDIAGELEHLGYEVRMPSLLGKKKFNSRLKLRICPETSLLIVG